MRKDLFQTSRKPVAPVPFPRDAEHIWYIAGDKASLPSGKLFSVRGYTLQSYETVFRSLTAEQLRYNFPGAGISVSALSESAFRAAVTASLGLDNNPAVSYFIRWIPEDEHFAIVATDHYDEAWVKEYAESLTGSNALVLENCLTGDDDGPMFSIKGGGSLPSFGPSPAPRKRPLAPTIKDEVERIAEETERSIKNLVMNDFPIEVIESWIQAAIKPSRLLIDKNFRIFLVDYDNKEIVMDNLPKTLFFFYLKHEEGCPKKELIAYKKEIRHIYDRLTNKSQWWRIDKSVSDLVDPLGNSYSEKSAAVKSAFKKAVTDRVAKFYYIEGPQGGAKGIKLDRKLVTWEVEI